MKHEFKEIEPKWQKKWEEAHVFHAENDYTKPKYYALVEFPYPSGQGLHVGHPRSYTALDIVARKRRMQGYNVLYPMGWDAFGLPTENFAIKNHIHPEIVTAQNVAHFKAQLKSLGLSFDWDREINTTDPGYYKWTQWIFLQLFKKGLAYKKEMSVNWCTSCKCVLANEEVVNGVCERCGSEVIHKVKSQWMLKITAYAQRLIDDLSDVNYLERVKTSQINWIGRSTGAEVEFDTTGGDELLIYTTRPDTLFGATYMVMSPEHPYIEKWADRITNMDAVREYQEVSARKSDFERTEMAKDKTGVRLEGDAVRNLTLIFLEMWGTTQKEMPAIEPYLPAICYTAREAATVLPYADNPLDDEATGENVYLNMIRSAKEYVYITTPYLILDTTMRAVLCAAAKSGIDVRIITPGIPDKKPIYSVTRSFYNQLVKHGVRIFEWTPGFCHAKMSVADDIMATCGTINLDYRSLYHHFENGCFMADCEVVHEIRDDFIRLFAESAEVTEKYRTGRSARRRLGQSIMRLFAGLL